MIAAGGWDPGGGALIECLVSDEEVAGPACWGLGTLVGRWGRRGGEGGEEGGVVDVLEGAVGGGKGGLAGRWALDRWKRWLERSDKDKTEKADETVYALEEERCRLDPFIVSDALGREIAVSREKRDAAFRAAVRDAKTSKYVSRRWVHF